MMLEGKDLAEDVCGSGRKTVKNGIAPPRERIGIETPARAQRTT